MNEPLVVGRIEFSSIANPNTWNIDGDSKRLVFSSPSEAKRAEELFSAMQRELKAQSDRIDALEKRLEVNEHGYDGISCRDETIKLQDARIDALERALREMCEAWDQFADGPQDIGDEHGAKDAERIAIANIRARAALEDG